MPDEPSVRDSDAPRVSPVSRLPVSGLKRALGLKRAVRAVLDLGRADGVCRVREGGFAGRLRATISGNLFQVLRDDRLRFVRFEDEVTPGLLFPCRLDPK